MGKKTFTSLNCTQCHWIDDVAFPKPTDARLLRLSLGSEIRFVKSYEDIITAITNPQHVVDKQHAEFLEDLFPEVKITSFMPNMSGGITVTQLMDLVAFLDQVYQKIPDGYLKE